MAQPKVTFSILDKSNEVGRVGFYLPEMDGANYETVSSDLVLGNVGDIRLAMNDIILGNHLRRVVTSDIYEDSAVLPASGFAQREFKAQFTYRDTVTAETYTFEVPTFDTGTYAQDGTDVLDLSSGNLLAFKNAVEGNAVSRNGNAIEIVSARIVGRSI